MGHPEDCDCSRCLPPMGFYQLPEIKEQRSLRSNKNKIYEMRKEQEERVLQRIKLAPKEIDFQDTEEYTDQDEEVKAVLADILRRFKKGTVYFNPVEIQIAFCEWNRLCDQQIAPSSSLSMLLLSTLVQFSDSEKLVQEVRSFTEERVYNKGRLLMRLMLKMEEPYSRLCVQIGGNPDAYLVRFMHDGFADLFNTSQDDKVDGAAKKELTEEVAGKKSVDRLPDCEVRQILQRNDRREKKKYPGMFKMNGGWGYGRITPPYWPIALATDDQGCRYLSDEKLDAILPGWHSILTGNKIGSYSYWWNNLEPEFKKWVAREKLKLKRIGIEDWPSPYFRKDGEMGNPDSPSEVWRNVTRTWPRQSDSPPPTEGNDGLVSPKSLEQSTGVDHVQDPQSANEEASVSGSLDVTRASFADNDLESTSGISNLFPDLEVSENNESNAELLDALETVILNIRGTMDTFTEEHRSIIINFKEDVNRSIDKRLQQLEHRMHMLLIANEKVNKKRRRSPSPISRSSRAILRSRFPFTSDKSEQRTLETSVHQKSDEPGTVRAPSAGI